MIKLILTKYNQICSNAFCTHRQAIARVCFETSAKQRPPFTQFARFASLNEQSTLTKGGETLVVSLVLPPS